MPHIGHDPWRLVYLPLEACHAPRALRRDVCAAVGEGDLEVEDPALNAQPLGARGGQRVFLAREGGAQLFGPAADAREHAAALAGLDVVPPSLHAAVGVAVGAAPSVLVAVLPGDDERRQRLAAGGTRGARLAEQELAVLHGAQAVVGLR